MRPHESRPRPWVKICGLTRPADARRAIDLGADLLGINFWPRSPRHVDLAAAREIAAAASGRVTLVGVFVDEHPERIEELSDELGLDLVQLHGDEPTQERAAFARRLIDVVRADDLSSTSFGFEARPAGGALSGPDGDAAFIVGEKLPSKGEGGSASALESARSRRSVERVSAAPVSESSSLRWKASDSGAPSHESLELSGRAPTQGSLSPHWKVSASESELPVLFLIDAPRDARHGGTGEPWAWGGARAWIAARPRPVLIAGGILPGRAARALAASGAAGVDVASGVESAPGVKDGERMRRLIEEVRSVAT
jgi:phosphoribosylanthranilate isomerase